MYRSALFTFVFKKLGGGGDFAYYVFFVCIKCIIISCRAGRTIHALFCGTNLSCCCDHFPACILLCSEHLTCIGGGGWGKKKKVCSIQ